MGTKPFMVLLAIVVVIGFGLGGAFIGGIAVGKAQAETPVAVVQSASTRAGGAAVPQQATGSALLDAAGLDALRQSVQSGTASPEQLAQLRQQFQGQGSAGGGGFGGFGGGALGGDSALTGGGRVTGTIEAITDGFITLNTQQGPIEVAVGADTMIEVTLAGALGDLAVGGTVTVVGTRGDDGTFGATTVTAVPDGRIGAGRFFGAGGAVPIP